MGVESSESWAENVSPEYQPKCRIEFIGDRIVTERDIPGIALVAKGTVSKKIGAVLGG